MLLGTHLLTGAVVGEAVENPYLAFLLGFVLHFIIDAIPHFDTIDDDELTKRQILLISVEGIIGIAIFVYCYLNFSSNKAGFLAGAFGSALPDLVDNVPFWNKSFQKTRFGKSFHNFHYHIYTIKPFLGLAVQVVIIITAFLLLRYLR